ncbi:hypothetical protein GGR57DRAFT_341785 [Xylariaceae sp. FL1272]|nr:hypothetical protein GGR57DRAFT_341785 [Xylariaceae sp. FL1272]
MATIARQPFAPLNESRLQTLTSLKNRQNAVSSPSPVKRKAADVADLDNSENVDPISFSKRAKGSDGFFPSQDSFIKPSKFLLTKSASTNDVAAFTTPAAVTPRPRSVLNPKSQTAKLNTSLARSSPLSAPAGRSPTRGKRSGILSSRRRTAGSYSRVEPPVFGLPTSSASAPFSLDAALKGTISSYSSRSELSSSQKSSSTGLSSLGGLHEPDSKSSWFFDIHEDTPEQEMTNLLQHSTCVLDISSDEESESRLQRERAEGKENVPPVDDVSQTSRPRAARLAAGLDDMTIEKERNPLGEMDPKEYYSEGCDENSVIIIPGDEDEEAPTQADFNFSVPVDTAEPVASATTVETPVPAVETEPEPEAFAEETAKTVEKLMQKTDEPAPGAAVLEPMEGTGESFEVWESGSTKDENEAPVEC